jgi:thiol-disulfide isomerase/thioredoxin
MKKLVMVLPIVLLLSGCTNPSPSLKGEVISCSEIKTLQIESSNEPLDCLDGFTGVAIDSIKGPAIINVWGSWCNPCRDEIPFFREFYSQMDPSIQLIGVDVEERTRADGQKFVRDFGITWANLYDAAGSTREYFGLGVPVTWFINSSGETVHKHIGPIKSLIELKNLSSKYLGVS